MTKAILFDADGVLTVPEELFSVMYARSHGLDPESFEEFFQTEWNDYVIGERDIKHHIQNNHDLWRWSGSPDELVAYWCKAEDIRNDQVIEVVKQLRSNGSICCLATEQERHRGEYMKNVMFKDLFDDFFITAEIGVKKSEPKFYEIVYEQLNRRHGSMRVDELLFFDDSQSKVDAAASTGIDAYLFTSADELKNKLVEKKLL